MSGDQRCSIFDRAAYIRQPHTRNKKIGGARLIVVLCVANCRSFFAAPQLRITGQVKFGVYQPRSEHERCTKPAYTFTQPVSLRSNRFTQTRSMCKGVLWYLSDSPSLKFQSVLQIIPASCQSLLPASCKTYRAAVTQPQPYPE